MRDCVLAVGLVQLNCRSRFLASSSFLRLGKKKKVEKKERIWLNGSMKQAVQTKEPNKVDQQKKETVH